MENPIDVVKEAREKMLAIITSVAEPKDANKILEIRKKYSDFVFVSLGMHPEMIENYTDDEIEKYIDLIRKNKDKIVAIGEVGLDYNWVEEEEKQEHSKIIFQKFIDLAKQLNKPIVIHSRNGKKNAVTEVLDIIEEKKQKNVIMHCFSGSNTELKRALDLGYFISFATIICKSEKHKRLATATPIEKMLLETDAPWLDPFSRELTNKPWKIIEAAKVIADLKKIPKEKILEQTTNNAEKIFELNL
jgi:TatD DNase family protein